MKSSTLIRGLIEFSSEKTSSKNLLMLMLLFVATVPWMCSSNKQPKIKQINKLIIVIMLIMFSIKCITTTRIPNHQDDHDEWLLGNGRPKRIPPSTTVTSIFTNLSINHHHQHHFTMNELFPDESENLIADSGDMDHVSRQKSIGQSILQFHQESLMDSLQSDSRSNLLDDQQELIFRPEWNFTEVNLANSHLFYIRTKYSCSTPRAKLVKVLDYHASPSKQYVPRCTVLHRCDDESGCCEDVTHRCEPSKTQLVELYFHVIRSDMKNNITGGNAVGIERLTFLNHTQCECKPINYMPRSVHIRPLSSRLVAAKKPTTNTPYGRPNGKGDEGHHHKCKHVIKCPQPFLQRFRGSDQRCVCDCGGLSSHPEEVSYKYCLKIQDGSAKLDPRWARCIDSKECSEPVCSAGMRYNQTEWQCKTYVLQHRIRHHHNHHRHNHHQAQYRQTTQFHHQHHHPVW